MGEGKNDWLQIGDKERERGRGTCMGWTWRRWNQKLNERCIYIGSKKLPISRTNIEKLFVYIFM